jgi:hypothetical protein
LKNFKQKSCQKFIRHQNERWNWWGWGTNLGAEGQLHPEFGKMTTLNRAVVVGMKKMDKFKMI